jgi:hypothetical protein
MRIIENLKARTPRLHKIAGRIATALSIASLSIAESGIVDSRPLIKIALQSVSVLFGGQAVYHGQKTLK